MTLRVRLLLGYGYLVALLLLATGSAMLGFLELSESVDVVLEENLYSIHASMRMLEALERQDSATLAALLDDDPRRGELQRQDDAFHAALEEAQANITESAEQPVLQRIRETFGRYRRQRDELIRESPERPLRAYNERVFPAFRDVKLGVLELLEINQQAVIEADRRTRETALRGGAWLGLLVAVALVSLVFLSRALQRRLLSRLHDLRHDLAALGGVRQRRLRVSGDDELTQVARHVNELLDDLQEEKVRHRGRLAEERGALLGVLRHLGEEAVLYDLSGRLMATGAGGEETAHPELREWIVTQGRELLDADGGEDDQGIQVQAEGNTRRLFLLRTGEGRPVGWLTRPD